MAVPNYVSRSIALFGGKLTSVFDSAANEGAGIDYGASFTSFGVGNSVNGHDSGDGTTTHVYSTTIAVAPAATITIAAGVVVAVSGGNASPAVSGGSLSISGIVSATLDLSVTPVRLTVVFAEAATRTGSPDAVDSSGNRYLMNSLISGDETTTHVYTMDFDSPGYTPSTLTANEDTWQRVSDNTPNIAISNYPITVIPAASSSGTFRNRVLPCIQAAQLNTRTKP